MLPQQKEALIVLCSSIIFTFLIIPINFYFSTFRIELVFITLVVFIAIIWIGRISIGLRPRAFDERDMHIRYQVGMYSLHGFGIAVVIGAAILCLLYRTSLMVPVWHVALLVYFSWMAMYMIWSISILIIYRKAV